jgi:Transthyretin-like family
VSYLFSAKRLILAVLLTSCSLLAESAIAEDTIKGQVLGGGTPIVRSTVTLWEASAGAPKQIAQTKTDSDGHFEMRGAATGSDTSLYLVATAGEPKSGGGDNPAIVLLSVLGNKAPSSVTINEMTTVASVWTNNQFLNGNTLQGHALGSENRGWECADFR